MPVIDMNGTVVPNHWVEGEWTASATGTPLLVAWQNLENLPAEDIGRVQPLGARLPSNTDMELVAPLLRHLELVVIEFPSFRDGRGFTMASTLRHRYGFDGELRASGHVLPDQFDALYQCGFSTLETPASHPPEQWSRSASAGTDEGPLLKRLLVRHQTQS